MSKVFAVAIGIIAAVSLTACGSSNDASKTATAALKSELLQQSASGASAFTFTDAQAQCASSGIVSGVGTQGLQQYGLLDSGNKATAKTLDGVKMSTKDATTLVNTFINCLGEANFAKALTDAVSKSVTGEKTQAQRTCLQSKLTIAALKPMLISSLTGDPASAQKFYSELATCIPSS